MELLDADVSSLVESLRTAKPETRERLLFVLRTTLASVEVRIAQAQLAASCLRQLLAPYEDSSVDSQD